MNPESIARWAKIHDAWEITYFPSVVEFVHRTTRRKVIVPVPYDPQPVTWWVEQVEKGGAK